MSDQHLGQWSLRGTVLGCLIGTAAGVVGFQSLFLISPWVKVAGTLGAALSGILILGGWRSRWRKFPWARAIGTILGLLSLTTWLYQRSPPSQRVEAPVVAGPGMVISASDFSISGVKPDMTDKQVEALLGKPTWARSEVEDFYGMTLEITRATYDQSKLSIVYLEGKVESVAGELLELKGVALLKAGDRHKRVVELWGRPSTNESRPGYDVYGAWRPAVAVRFEADRITGFELGSRLAAAQPAR